MSDRRLDHVRAKLVRLLRADPPGNPFLALDHYVMERLSRDEIEVMLRAEREYGAAAMSEWLAEALVEGGVIPRALPLAG